MASLPESIPIPRVPPEGLPPPTTQSTENKNPKKKLKKKSRSNSSDETCNTFIKPQSIDSKGGFINAKLGEDTKSHEIFHKQREMNWLKCLQFVCLN
jgi:hypothetical protein